MVLLSGTEDWELYPEFKLRNQGKSIEELYIISNSIKM